MCSHDTPNVVEIPLRGRKHRGHVALIDAADAELVSQYRWATRHSRGTLYAASYTPDGYIWMHRLILGLGPDDKREGDHINRDGLDNRRENLRICTHAQNSTNRRKQSNNTSGYKGVTWSAQHRKWRTQLISNGKRHHIGLFSTAEEAARAYDAAAREIHGEFASLNFGDEDRSI